MGANSRILRRLGPDRAVIDPATSLKVLMYVLVCSCVHTNVALGTPLQRP